MFDVGIEELLLRIAKIFGRVVHGLKHFEMHQIYAEKFLQFFDEICRHKDAEMRKQGAYNLACFNLYYKDYVNLMYYSGGNTILDFHELYYSFSKDPETSIKFTVASSIHEAFLLTE